MTLPVAQASSRRRWPEFVVPALHPDKSAHLDMIRSLAAFAVMWGHLRILLFEDYPQLRHPGAFTKFLYAVTGFGHQSVMVFFVLSGFFISSGILKRLEKGSWSWSHYLSDRLVRLYIVLVPGLILGALWDNAGSILFRSNGAYSQPLQCSGNLVVTQSLTPYHFAGNLLFLQTIFCKSFGSNGPLWSIANEFWYYMLFPALLLLARPRRRLIPALVYASMSGAIALLIGIDRLYGFFIWLTGMMIVWASSRHFLRRRSLCVLLACLSAALLGISLCVSRTSHQPLASDLMVGLSFAAALYVLLQFEDSRLPDGYRALAHNLAGFSFSLYVLHFPVLMFMHAWFVPHARWQPDLSHLLSGAGLGVLTISYCWLVASVTEKHTGDLRHYIALHWLTVPDRMEAAK